MTKNWLMLILVLVLSLSACEFETPTPTEEPAEVVALETEVPTELQAMEEPVETEVPTESSHPLNRQLKYCSNAWNCCNPKTPSKCPPLGK